MMKMMEKIMVNNNENDDKNYENQENDNNDKEHDDNDDELTLALSLASCWLPSAISTSSSDDDDDYDDDDDPHKFQSYLYATTSS